MTNESTRVIAVVTGSRAEYGLLRPVMRAIETQPSLTRQVFAAGAHLLPPDHTINEVSAEFPVAGSVLMQRAGENGRVHDAAALGRGVSGFAEAFASARPDVVVVLGDRIEAFAAASAAAIGGIRVAHIHGGDRAEGIADESMRHAITKLAHIHFPATASSAQRIIAMGEEPQRVHIVGSPALDDLQAFGPLPDSEFRELGEPRIVVLLHPVGEGEAIEQERAEQLMKVTTELAPTLALHPNHDPGRAGIIRALEKSGCRHISHLSREKFVGLLRRAHVLIGNSSAGLIECAALGAWCINLGSRQAGREMPLNVIDIPNWNYGTIASALQKALASPRPRANHPYGDGNAGRRIAELLASLDPHAHAARKRNTY